MESADLLEFLFLQTQIDIKFASEMEIVEVRFDGRSIEKQGALGLAFCAKYATMYAVA